MKMVKTLVAMILVAGCLALPAWAEQQQDNVSYGVPNDWSHHHLIFSKPRSQAALAKLQQDPRYRMQQAWRQRQANLGDSAAVFDAKALQIVHSWGHPVMNTKGTLKKDWSESMGAGTHGTAGVYPAKYGFSITTASCQDYVVFPTAGGANGVASIIAYSELYSGCAPATVPTPYWALNVTSSSHYSSVVTSPVLSNDGTQAAFIATISSHAYLIVALMPKITSTSSSVTSTSCTATSTINSASQGTSLVVWCAEFGDANNDTGSSPFYDYTNNVLYVGDNSGRLHKFQNVFHTSTNTTAPSELGTPWPVDVNGTETLTSPTYDSTSGYVFVGDDSGRLSAVSSGGSLNSTHVDVGNGSGRPLVDGPIVDSNSEKVFAFIGCTGISSECGFGSTNAQVVQAATTLTSGSVVRADIGLSSDSDNVRDGDFDNSYYSTTYSSGHLYVCGNPDGFYGRLLYQIGFDSSGTMNSAGTTAVLTLTGAVHNECSPLTELYNGSEDRLFLSVPSDGALTCSGTCSTGDCLYSFNIDTLPSACEARTDESGGTSGISVDNSVSTPAGTSQLYFSPLGAGTAVQVSQSGL